MSDELKSLGFVFVKRGLFRDIRQPRGHCVLARIYKLDPQGRLPL